MNKTEYTKGEIDLPKFVCVVCGQTKLVTVITPNNGKCLYCTLMETSHE